MKRFLMLALVMFATACTWSNDIPVKQKNGLIATRTVNCIGVLNDPQPNIKYEVSRKNVVIGAVLFGGPLIVVAAVDYKCPVADTSITP
jgi:hypothetical protein